MTDTRLPIAKHIGATLRYFKRGYDRDPLRFWITEAPFANLRVLLTAQLIEMQDPPNSDLYRITEAGLSVLGG